MNKNPSTQPTAICDECKSEFYSLTSKLSNLCPECAHFIYGYENCRHEFSEGRCVKCYWDGSSSVYIKSLKKDKL